MSVATPSTVSNQDLDNNSRQRRSFRTDFSTIKQRFKSKSLLESSDDNAKQSPLTTGLEYNCKLLGSKNVEELRGKNVCQTALYSLKAKLKEENGHKMKIIFKINIDGISIFDAKNKILLHKHPVNRISFVSKDSKDSKSFGYIVSLEDKVIKYFGYKADKSAETVVSSIHDLFMTVKEMKNKNCISTPKGSKASGSLISLPSSSAKGTDGLSLGSRASVGANNKIDITDPLAFLKPQPKDFNINNGLETRLEEDFLRLSPSADPKTLNNGHPQTAPVPAFDVVWVNSPPPLPTNNLNSLIETTQGILQSSSLPPLATDDRSIDEFEPGQGLSPWPNSCSKNNLFFEENLFDDGVNDIMPESESLAPPPAFLPPPLPPDFIETSTTIPPPLPPRPGPRPYSFKVECKQKADDRIIASSSRDWGVTCSNFDNLGNANSSSSSLGSFDEALAPTLANRRRPSLSGTSSMTSSSPVPSDAEFAFDLPDVRI